MTLALAIKLCMVFTIAPWFTASVLYVANRQPMMAFVAFSIGCSNVGLTFVGEGYR